MLASDRKSTLPAKPPRKGRPIACGSRRISDESRWLELHGGRSLVVERRTGKQQTLHLPHATVSLTGTNQPETLGQKFLKSRIPCGLSSRLLFAYPTPGPRRWTDDDVDEPVAEDFASVVHRLLSLEFKSWELSSKLRVVSGSS